VDSGERGKDEGFVIYLRMSRRALMEFRGASAHGLDRAIRIVCYFLRLIRQSTALAC